jgi:hypothetical protein
LFAAYASATAEFFRLDSKLKVAKLSHNPDAVEQLLPAVENAAKRRERLQAESTQHESDAHPSADAARA